MNSRPQSRHVNVRSTNATVTVLASPCIRAEAGLSAGLPSACGGDINSAGDLLEASPYMPLPSSYCSFLLLQLHRGGFEPGPLAVRSEGNLLHEDGRDQRQDQDRPGK